MDEVLSGLRWLRGWYEELIILIHADNDADAQAKAESYAQHLVGSLQAEAQPNVKWSLIAILAVQEVAAERLKDATEIFSRFLTRSESRSLLRAHRQEKP